MTGKLQVKTNGNGYTYKEAGKGILIHKDGDTLIIKINLAANHGLSKSEKSITVGSTGGALDVGNGVQLNINCYKKAGLF